MTGYDVVEHAATIAVEADFRARWQADREQMWARILDELPNAEITSITIIAKNNRSEAAPPPKVLQWWRRLAIRLLRGEA